MEEPDGLCTGGDAELIPQGLGSDAVLAAYQLLLMLEHGDGTAVHYETKGALRLDGLVVEQAE